MGRLTRRLTGYSSGGSSGSGSGGIDLSNPIAANSTGSISPVAGAYYTSTSALVTLTSTSGTADFLPEQDRDTSVTTSTLADNLADTTASFNTTGVAVGDTVENITDSTSTTITNVEPGGQVLTLADDIMTSGETYRVVKDITYRKLWGTGAGAAITLTINPTNLVDGDVFFIELDKGESRVIKWDSTNFTRVGGVELPQKFKMSNRTAQTGLTLATWAKATFDVIEYDPASLAASNDVTMTRDAMWTFKARWRFQMAAGGAFIKAIAALGLTPASGTIDEFFGFTWPDESNTTDQKLVSTGGLDRAVVVGEVLNLLVFADGSGAASFTQLGDVTAAKTALYGLEVVPW